MRQLIYILFLVFSVQSFAQVINQTAPATNSPATKSEEEIKEYKIQKENSNDIDKKKSESLSDGDNSYEQTKQSIQLYSITKEKSSTNRYSRSPSAGSQKIMNDAVNQLKSIAPNSFEYHLFAYTAGNYNIELIDHLNKAEKLQPNNNDVLTQKAAYHFIKNEQKQAADYLKKLYTNKKISSEIVSYTEDLLLSVPKNGILIVHGFDDAFGAMYNQMINKKRTDVKIVSLDFIQSDAYCKALKTYGLSIPDNKTVDVSFFESLCENNTTKTLAIATTLPKEYLKNISENLFITGLVFEYKTDKNYNNFSENEKLWNSTLTKKVLKNTQSEKAKKLTSNYLPMLLQLSQVYQKNNKVEERKIIDQEIKKIAEQSGKYEQIKKMLSAY